MSSDITQTCGCSSNTAASARNRSASYAAPLGLPGEFRNSHFVRAPIDAARSAGASVNPLASLQGTQTGTPPAIRIISGYDAQYGAGTIASSPGSSVAIMALKMICLAPAPTAI